MRIKSLISLIILILILSNSIIIVSANYNSKSNIIYVDDDNINGPWYGTIDHPYRFIQDGVDSGNEGDTVFVSNGLYLEDIIIEKSLSLIGENNRSTIIDGNHNGTCILITDTRNCIISNFFINDAYYTDDLNTINAGILLINSSYNSIFYNVFNDSLNGIFLYNSSNNSIYENFFYDNSYSIRLKYSCNNRIEDNYIIGGGDGVYIEFFSNINKIFNNKITTHHRGIATYHNSQNNMFENNILDSDCDFYLMGNGYCIVKNNIAGHYNIVSDNNHIENNTGISSLILFGTNNKIENNKQKISNTIKNEVYRYKNDDMNIVRHNDISNLYLRSYRDFSHVYYNNLGKIEIDSSPSLIEKNNIEKADFESVFIHYSKFSFKNNYWFKTLNRPKLLLGTIIIVIVIIPTWWEYWIRIPAIKYDISPSYEPYEI